MLWPLHRGRLTDSKEFTKSGVLKKRKHAPSTYAIFLRPNHEAWPSIMQNDIGQQLRSHVQFAVVIDQSHFSELVHEVRDPRTSCAYHFRQRFMTEQRDLCIRHELGLAQPGQFQEYTGQPLFAVVEKLIAEVLFQVDVTNEQRGDEPFTELMLTRQGSKHRSLLDTE